jgi:hypothetical protein
VEDDAHSRRLGRALDGAEPEPGQRGELLRLVEPPFEPAAAVVLDIEAVTFDALRLDDPLPDLEGTLAQLEELPIEELDHQHAARRDLVREQPEDASVRGVVEPAHAGPHRDHGVEAAGKPVELAHVERADVEAAGTRFGRHLVVQLDADAVVAKSGERLHMPPEAARDVQDPRRRRRQDAREEGDVVVSPLGRDPAQEDVVPPAGSAGQCGSRRNALNAGF